MLNKAKKNKKGLPRATCPDRHLSRRESRGFTIIELVVVVIIIAILASIAFVSYESSRKQARDARRVADMTNIESSLRMYYLRIGSFPATLSDTAGTNLVTAGYFQTIPKDPTSGNNYDYSNQTTYSVLHATLEDTNNVPKTTLTTLTEFTCTASTVNFCLKVAP